MREVKVVIEFSEDGEIVAETHGIKGEACLTELELLLKDLAEIESVDKTGEYYQTSSNNRTTKISNRR
ncbi:DUF2997 domain-containing protein [Bacillus tianshenii]|uniref:DUF2997 domain-containing protein n=1 Tax=Sutcliffiella tianshenii TaxID=1463404 RepID=UPI001958CEFC|nr:DUF2997 domain-containing protein [Bacillus tianshenii]